MVDLDVSPVLPLSERLAQLRPSAELLQFYRDKVCVCRTGFQSLYNILKLRSLNEFDLTDKPCRIETIPSLM